MNEILYTQMQAEFKTKFSNKNEPSYNRFNLFPTVIIHISRKRSYDPAHPSWLHQMPDHHPHKFPLLIQTGIISIIIGTLITLLISHLHFKPLHTLVEAIHQVSTGNYDVKIHLEHPAEFREVSDCFNHMTEELSCTEMLRSDFINNFSHRIQDPDCLRSWIREIIKIRPTHKRSTRRISGHYYRRVQALIRTFHDHT